MSRRNRGQKNSKNYEDNDGLNGQSNEFGTLVEDQSSAN